MQDFSVYILRCGDGSYYTGIATDVARRIAEHESGARGAKYLRGRAPFELVFAECIGDRSRASQVEYRVKQLTRDAKQQLVDGRLELSDVIAAQDSDGA